MTIHALKRRFQAGDIAKPEFIARALDIHRHLFDCVALTGSTDVHEIHITPDGVSFLMGEERLCLFAPPEEARVAPIEVLNFDRYEPAETRAMDALTLGAKQILDVGANIGWYAVRFARRLPQAQVHAFEPMPTAHAYLQRNVAANGLGNRVTCYSHGLSDQSGSVKFFVAPQGGTNASLLNVSEAPDARSVVGLTLTLDDWVTNQGVAPEFIKCDVEGAELLVFRGGRSTLQTYRPIVFTELLRKWSKPFGYHPNDMLGFFADLGYSCWAVGDAGVRPIQQVADETPETNYAFLHPDAHADALTRLLANGATDGRARSD